MRIIAKTALLLCVVCHAHAAVEIKQTDVSPYTGSEECRPCHEKIYDKWYESNHRKYLLEATIESVIGDFSIREPLVFSGVENRVYTKDGKYYMWTRGVDGKENDYLIRYILGNRQQQCYLTEFPGGKLQILPLFWQNEEKVWADSTEVEQQRGEVVAWEAWTSRHRTWNQACFNCHGLAIVKNYNVKQDVYETEWKETGIGCERCHGPGREHVRIYEKVLKVPDPLAELTKRGAHKGLESCGECHSAKRFLTLDYIPGDNFDDHFNLSLSDGTEIFFPDGRSRKYVYPSFLQSQHRLKDGMTCTACHDPHGSEHSPLLKKDPENELCVSCHEKISPAHKHHEVASPKTTCIECHMTRLVFQRMKRSDHICDSPEPSFTQASGIPNACNICHKDHDAAWSSQWLVTWYGREQDRRRKMAGAFDSARAGQAEGALALLGDKEKSAYIQATAARLVNLFGDDADRDVLAGFANHAAPLVRAAVVESLAVSQQHGELLKEKMHDPSRLVRNRTTAALLDRMDLGVDWEKEPAKRLLQEFRKSFAIMPDDPVAQVVLGALALRKGDVDATLQHYDNALMLDPKLLDIHLQKIGILQETGRRTEAEDGFRKMLNAHPDFVDGWFAFGVFLMNTGSEQSMKEGIQCMQRVLDLEPTYRQARFYMALAFEKTNNLSRAIDALEKLIEQDPKDTAAHMAAARCLYQQGLFGKALKHLESLLTLDPGYVEARLLWDKIQAMDRP